VRIAHRLRDRLRETDTIARLGGDEFAVLLPQEDRHSATLVAEALLEHVRQEGPAAALGDRKRVSASVGIACFDVGDQLTGDEIMANADLAMYDAKNEGRDGMAAFRPERLDRPRIESRTNWASEISTALSDGRFELLAQPIRALRGENPTQYELLLRMRDPRGDQIPPATSCTSPSVLA
jgi:predicted signal transduction protein with EAL and GGDEF domain